MAYIVGVSVTMPILQGGTFSTTLFIKNLGVVPFDDESSLSALGCPSLKLAIVDEQLGKRLKQVSEALGIGGYATVLISPDVLQELRAKRTDSLDRCQDRGRHLSPLPFAQESSGVEDGNYLSLHLTLPKDLQSLDATVRLSSLLRLLL
ncbi:hypothetical protein IQ217_18475 [Synechocystis salina LEGE 00031]|uniref:Uncharacterized protein n=2 Tax=Synechocystis TaxID=1142 RepID=A0ABR9VZF3_9SYNC|nr:hypothetical protein [Synechocystis salina LEGE 00041]MBE9255773.1 hypothetical protein [Synechocystis salina LEGE 00031]